MEKYLDTFINSFLGTVNWTYKSIIFEVPWYTNYFWGLIFISLIVWGLEIVFPWRKNQAIIRKDFWLDAFYMFFNFFVFSIVISGFYKVLGLFFGEFNITTQSLALINISNWSPWLQLLAFFLILDFVQWFTHVLLHRYEFLWNFHKVHHSVKEMGFAAHLRYHWMENVLYKPLKVFGVMILGGFEPEQAYIVHFIAITIGHLNHSNIKLTYGPLKYIFNNPVMHLYHHAYTIPEGRHGINYGISLSLWDYIFKTNYVPEDSGTIEIGFEGDDQFPKDFIGQNTYGFKKEK
ncbi:sterol desaturase/sphingolipid hydroxylase (fatty acid hydroxylase superfamily) [Mesoflavibacter sabulilitoris]|uniref:Sterol desaturase n=1 Tax=Mesoflavibacter zeaxanthinifaciens subsp. sabulilitoris TaxID=1520893 RepID=A0A2T1N7L8_9FLAO|nr:sterol desaturase family protein [Mesoflavibacter zeaxanthinifaciens]MBB3123961.1 sterol desaturase/sphingolipid hydroxylase (fatty acid hydroxylase superfamily) [Mesoflavibacter zeaxanthinifaciens subsp. sabulilitoris]PSG87862.1 sterol desaturase [Mesoflavibacter zeaxanthinifaciens subsp. sabulilitoris]